MNTMLATAQATIRQAAKDLGYDDAVIEAFLRPEHEHVFQITVAGKTYPAYRMQHNSKLGPYKGGIRFHPNVSHDEVRALATLMSIKTAAVGLPLGGGKGGVTVDPGLLSAQDLEALSRAYARELAPYIGSDKDIPAPDVNTDGRIMDWMLDEYQKTVGHADPGAFTGKSMANGGSEGREAATGRGGALVLAEYLKSKQLMQKPLTLALQGFGNVGYFFALALAELCPHVTLIAVANSKHTWLQPGGIVVAKGAADPRPEQFTGSGAQELDSSAVIGVKADILVLAALENAVHQTNAASVQASLIVELANGPITQEAELLLTQKGVAILPDVVANAGGVIVSCLEWQQNRNNEHWLEADVNQKLRDILVPAAAAMLQRADQKHTSYKQAAFELALIRLLS